MAEIEARIPQRDELDVARQYMGGAFNGVEIIKMCLDRVLNGNCRDVAAALTVEHAWELTQFARELRGDADQLGTWGDDIERLADNIWSEYCRDQEATR